jgi:2-amino-4-hydroxy-6-hydroxymethyldihydropteridine diphosphokinase
VIPAKIASGAIGANLNPKLLLSSQPMAEVYIGLGSNLGDHGGNPETQLHQAIESISQHPDINLMAVSPRYQTQAIGPGNQPDYINAVARLNTELSPLDLLDCLQQIEHQQGRVRTIRWGARTIDLDILLYNDRVIDSERLTVPHPRMHERAFVLAPLRDLNASIVLPNGENILSLLANCSDQGIVKFKSLE